LPERDPNSKHPRYRYGDQHHWRCGTGIGPDRDIIARSRHIAASCPSLPTALAAPARNTGGKARLLDGDRRIPARDQTVCWREMDSNFQYASTVRWHRATDLALPPTEKRRSGAPASHAISRDNSL